MKMEYGLNTSPTAHEVSLMFIKGLELNSTDYYWLFINSCCLAPSHSFHMSKKGILWAAEPAKPLTASTLLSAFPYCNSLPAPPLQIPTLPLHLQSPLLPIPPVSPPSSVVLDSLPRPPCWGRLVRHRCSAAKNWEHENWLDLRDRRAKMRADSTVDPFSATKLPADGACTAPSLPGLCPPLSVSWN